jgi:putative hydrolase of the HAD superfamily
MKKTAALPRDGHFRDICEWVFDLDNTLYPRHADLSKQMDRRITDYVRRVTGLPADEARDYQKTLYRDHGTTLSGLMARHAIDPLHYLADVHDIDYSAITPHPELARAIAALPGRKHIFTNGDIPHVERTLEALGFGPIFDAAFDIVRADYTPKPDRRTYERFIAAHVVEPSQAAMFEDMPRNLTVPKDMGMVTVLVLPHPDKGHQGETWEIAGHDDPHIDYASHDLAGFLQALMVEMRD